MNKDVTRGRIISKKDIRDIMKQPVGSRMKLIRLALNEIYPGEFNLKKVAEEIQISENGYAKVETGTTNVQDGTKGLAHKYYSKYNVPKGIFYEDSINNLGSFYLGKDEDKLPYFDAHYEFCGQKHFLDERVLTEITKDNYRYWDASFDIDQPDVDRTEDGEYQLNTFGIEITLNVYQSSTGQVLWEKRLNEMAEISPRDLNNLERAVRKDIDVIIKQYSELFRLQKELKAIQHRESLLSVQLQLSEKKEPSKSFSELEREMRKWMEDNK